MAILANQSKAAFDWLTEYLKVPYLNRADQFGGHSRARCYTPQNITGFTILKKQIEKTKELGIEIKKQMYFKEFILDSSGKVIGGIFKEGYEYKNPEKGKEIFIKSRKGVIICTGGFSSDIEFRQKYDDRLTKSIDTTNKLFATAEGIIEAMKVGADTVDMKYIQLAPWTSPDEKGFGVGPMFSEYIVFQYGMIIDPNTGKRFVNELADRKILSDALLSIGQPSIGIADSYAINYSGWNIDKALKKRVVLSFDSIEELANHYKIPKEGISQAIESFNESIKQGKDRCFNKAIIAGSKKISKAPFYGIRLWPKVHYTMGGLRINSKCQVINKQGKIIDGLFAAGEVTGGIHGANRLGNCAVSDCIVFGRIAGRNVAD